MNQFFTNLKQSPNSLYGKARVFMLVIFGVLLVSAQVAHSFPDHAISGLGAGFVIGLLIAGIAPWWVVSLDKSPARKHCLHPGTRLMPHVESILVAATALLLVAGYFMFEAFPELAVSLMVVGAATGTVLLSPHLPIWRAWPR